MKIAIGTTSEQKIGYLKEVLDEIGFKAEIFPVETESEVSTQPITEDETLQGSINRARKSLDKVSDADFGVGIEVGYHLNSKSRYTMFCCTTIIDRNNFIETCKSSQFLLPEFHQKVLKKGKFLREYVREYKKEVDEPVTNYIRELVRGRKPLIKEAVRNVLLIYLENKNE